MSRRRYYQMLVSPHIGGGAQLALAIQRRVSQVHDATSRVLVPAGGDAERRARDEGMDHVRYDLGRLTGSSRIASIAENLRILMMLAGTGGGLIHIHAPHVFGAARPFLYAANLKTVLHIHLDFEPDQLRWSLRNRPDLILVCADYMRKAVEQAAAAAGHASANIKLIRNAVDTERFFPADRQKARAALRLDAAATEPLLLMVANLAPHKGQETAIRCVALLKEHGRRVKLALAGTERAPGRDYLRKLQNLCVDQGVESQVQFLGFREDVPRLLQAADFLLLPSTSEGLPLVVLEAQASKTIVLAAPTAGIPEVVKDGTTGFLIGAADAAGYADRVARLLDDSEARRWIEQHAYSHVRAHHDSDSYLTRMLGEYDALLQS